MKWPVLDYAIAAVRYSALFDLFLTIAAGTLVACGALCGVGEKRRGGV
jgi:hypothetical protein